MNIIELIRLNYKYALAALVVYFVILVSYPGNAGTPKLAFLVIIIGVLASLLLPSFKDKMHYYKLLYLVVAFMGVSAALLTPILYTPDEMVHYSRALYISTGEVNMDNKKEHLQVTENYFQTVDERKELITGTELFQFPQSDRKQGFWKLVDFRATNAYSFLSYLPQVTGIVIARTFNLSVGHIFYLGRIMNAFFYALLIIIAVRLSGRFKQIVLMMATLPMNIILAGSYNQDGMAVGLQFVTIGYFIHLLEKKEKINFAQILMFSILSSLMIVCKIPYVMLFGLIVFIPVGRFKNKATYFSGWGVGILLAILALVWYKISGQVHFDNPDVQNVGTAEQIASMLKQPFASVLVLLREFFNLGYKTEQLWHFGWLDVFMTNLYPYLMLPILYIIAGNTNKIELKNTTRIGLALVGSAIALAIILSMYLLVTPIGGTNVLGVQGRYYIGVYTMFLLILSSIKIKHLRMDPIPDNFVIQTSLIMTSAVFLQSISLASTFVK